MTGNAYIDRHYETPNPPAPYELECFRVYVPRHSYYIGAFWRVYEFFTTWIAWTRDPLHKGIQAAELWRTAYDKARALYDITKGTCEMNVTGIRQNPNNKCELQVEFDGTNIWSTVADFKDCNGCGGTGAMQFDGVNVNIYDDCLEDFVPSGTPYNPTTSNIFDSLYAPDTQGQCNGAANIAAWMHDTATGALKYYQTVETVAAAAITVTGLIITGLGSNVVFDILLALLAAEYLTQADWWDDAALVDITSDVKDLLTQFMSDDGTIRQPNYAEATAAMLAMRDAQTPESALRARWGFEASFLQAFGPSIISRQNKYAGITDADCTGSGWTHVFDFTTGKQGFVEDEQTGAVYVNGAGWRSTLFLDEFDNTYRVAGIKRALTSRTLTSAKLYYNATLGSNEVDPDTERRQVTLLYNSHGTGLQASADTLAGANVKTWAGSQAAVVQFMGEVIVGYDGVDPIVDPGGVVTITKIVLGGEGSDPF